MKRWIVLVAVLVGCRTRVPSEDLTMVMESEVDQVSEALETYTCNDSGNSGDTPNFPDDTGPSLAFGLDPTGAPTTCLDIQFLQDGFASAIPFGSGPSRPSFIDLRKSCEASGALGPRQEFDIACEMCGRVHEAATREWRKLERGVSPIGDRDCFSCEPTKNCFWCEIFPQQPEVFFERIGTDFDFKIDDHGGLDSPTPIFPDDRGPVFRTCMAPPIVPTDLVYIYLTCWSYTKAAGVPAVDAINFPEVTYTFPSSYEPAKSPLPFIICAKTGRDVFDASGDPVDHWIWHDRDWSIWFDGRVYGSEMVFFTGWIDTSPHVRGQDPTHPPTPSIPK
jgi:hypothetical protein